MSFLQSRTNLAPQGIGKPVARKEDDRLLRGEGRYTDDVNLPGQAYAGVVRSPHAHARIRSIDAREALAMPGVLAVLTGRDAAQDGLKPIPFRPISPNPHEVQLQASFLAPYPLLPTDKARFDQWYRDTDGVYRPFQLEDGYAPDNCSHGERGCTSCTRACPRFRAWEPEIDEFMFGRTRAADEPSGIFKDIMLTRASDPVLAEVGQDGGLVSAILLYALEKDLRTRRDSVCEELAKPGAGIDPIALDDYMSQEVYLRLIRGFVAQVAAQYEFKSLERGGGGA